MPLLLETSVLADVLAHVIAGPAITWLVGVTIYCTFFNNNSLFHLHLASFYAQKLKKKLTKENAD